MRVESKNLWGSPGGLEVQRKDLWFIDLTNVAKGLNFDRLKYPYAMAQSVSSFEWNMDMDAIRRDSVPHNMPGWDRPPSPIRVTFLYDIGSSIIDLLHRWRHIIRIGRGPLSSEVALVTEDLENDLGVYSFDVPIRLLKGVESTAYSLISETLVDVNSFQVTRSFTIIKAWVQTLSLGDLNQKESGPLEITATLACSDIQPDYTGPDGLATTYGSFYRP